MENKMLKVVLMVVVAVLLTVFVTLFIAESSECDTYSAIYVSEGDTTAMDVETLRQIIAHNNVYKHRCSQYNNDGYLAVDKMTIEKLQKAAKKWKR